MEGRERHLAGADEEQLAVVDLVDLRRSVGKKPASSIACSRTSTGGTTGVNPSCTRRPSGFESRWIVRLKNGAPSSLAQQMPYQGPLVSALLIDGPRRDWLLAGPVPLEVLQADADRLW